VGGQHGHRVNRSRSRWAQLRHRVVGSEANRWSVLGKDADASLLMSLPALPTSLPRADLDGDDGLDLTDAQLDAADEVAEPVGSLDLDLAALRSDDVLLNALGNASSPSSGVATEPEINALLLSWRHDVDAEPLPELVDTETAMRTIFAAAHRNRRRPRFLVPLASAAAVLVIVFTGVGLAARDAQPGDTLWGLTQVLYSDHARSIVAADAVRTELSHASAALHEGHYGTARSALAQAQQTLPSVNNEDGQAALQAQQQNLLSQLAQSTGGNGQLPTTLTMPSRDSISSTLLPSTTPSPPTSSATTDPPPTTTTTTPSSPTTSSPTSSPPSPSSPSLQSGTVSNPSSGGTAGTDTGVLNAPGGTSPTTTSTS
jgi:hypothetical protein